MSTRALRKLHGKQELSDLSQFHVNHDDDNDSHTATLEIETETESINGKSESVPEPKAPLKKNKNKATSPINPFELLCSEDVNDDNSDLIERDNEVADENSPAHIVETSATKKKKRKKKKKGTQPQTICNEVNSPEDEIDASIREVNQLLGEIPTRTSHDSDGHMTYPTTYKALLSVEHKNFNPDNEMRKIFGSRVVQTDQGRNQGNRRRRNVMRKTTWLVQAKDTWPHLTKTGLTMDLVDTDSRGQHFVFIHNKEYQKIQFQFLDGVESIDPQNIINMANMYPHHIDTLLQVSEICKMSDDMHMATEFIERALYVFECSFHPLFSLTQGNARLDYKQQENRAFYIAVFRHLSFIGNRGCYRTSLEFCKLLLSLDPDGDPLCVLLMIDFYSLRSEQYSFLVQLYQEWEAHRNLSQLPNYAMSIPLAMFHLAQQDNRDVSKADEMLQDALIMFPGLLIPLLDKCSISPDAEVTKHSFFGPKAQLEQPKALEQLIALYVGRTFSCWKIPDVIPWLERNVREVLSRVDQSDPIVKDYQRKRLSRYQGTPRNIHRHIMMSEIQAATAALPPDLAHTPVMSYDPLPPTDSVAAYTRPTRPNRAQSSSNPLSMFFQSLMPNFNPQELAEAEGGAVGGERQNFRDGIAQVMDAMRDLLNNIQPVPAPVENEGNEDANVHEEEQEWD